MCIEEAKDLVKAILKVAENPELRFITSNTKEANNQVAEFREIAIFKIGITL